jgi:Domain of unknown function (DUF4270)
VKKFSLAFVLLTISFLIALSSCKKINEATSLGGDLIPGVDNVTTFEANLAATTDNKIFNDTTTIGFYEQVAIGHMNDPEFGQSHANAYFDISSSSYGAYPFIVSNRDSIKIDSVVLSLAYQGGYGDTNSTSQLSFRVFELSPSSNFNDTTFFQYRATPTLNDFATVSELGSRTFTYKDITDSESVIRHDTTKVANVLRIPLAKSFGDRLKNYDTANQYKNDSLFKVAFKGFAVKADQVGNSFAYFNFSDNSKTKLIIYYKATINGKDSLSSVEFFHTPIVPVILYHNPANYENGQANFISRGPSLGNSGAVLNNTNPVEPVLYVQSAPGSYVSITIPGLDNFGNKIIHRAEIIATRIPSASDNIFFPPPRLLLDRINANNDSAYLFEKDLVLGSDGSVGWDVFGGTLKSDIYRFNITRYVQGIVTRHERNDVLRLWAPLRAYEFDVNEPTSSSPKGSYIQLPVNSRIAEGRVVLGGGNNPNPNARLRLRIVYSNL